MKLILTAFFASAFFAACGGQAQNDGYYRYSDLYLAALDGKEVTAFKDYINELSSDQVDFIGLAFWSIDASTIPLEIKGTTSGVIRSRPEIENIVSSIKALRLVQSPTVSLDMMEYSSLLFMNKQGEVALALLYAPRSLSASHFPVFFFSAFKKNATGGPATGPYLRSLAPDGKLVPIALEGLDTGFMRRLIDEYHFISRPNQARAEDVGSGHLISSPPSPPAPR
jgi:hypothetical protein